MSKIEIVSQQKNRSHVPRVEVNSPKKMEATRLGPIIWKAYRDMRIEMETGAKGIVPGQPAESAVLAAKDVEHSFEIGGTQRFGQTAEAWVIMIRNQKQKRKQIAVGWLNNGVARPAGIAILSAEKGERRIDHLALSPAGKQQSVAVQLLQAAKIFHEGNPFVTDVIGSDITAQRQFRGLGFEDTGETSVLMVGRITVPTIEMIYPGA